MGRAISVTQLFSTKRKLLEFEKQWLASFGRPELKGSWIISGPSTNGKTAFGIQIAKMLTKWTKVYYNSMEEGDSESLKMAFRRQGMEEVRRRIIVGDKETIEEVKIRLRKKKAPKVVVTDSVQYTFMSVKDYFDLIKEFPNTLFIWVSHEKNKEPEGQLARKIWYDAMIKIRVALYRAHITSRYVDGIGPPIDVWPEKAAQLHPQEAF